MITQANGSRIHTPAVASNGNAITACPGRTPSPASFTRSRNTDALGVGAVAPRDTMYRNNNAAVQAWLEANNGIATHHAEPAHEVWSQEQLENHANEAIERRAVVGNIESLLESALRNRNGS